MESATVDQSGGRRSDELNPLDPDIPLIMEHLPDEAEFDLAAQHIRSVAAEKGNAI